MGTRTDSKVVPATLNTFVVTSGPGPSGVNANEPGVNDSLRLPEEKLEATTIMSYLIQPPDTPEDNIDPTANGVGYI
jgi:hypothetical protein